MRQLNFILPQESASRSESGVSHCNEDRACSGAFGDQLTGVNVLGCGKKLRIATVKLLIAGMNPQPLWLHFELVHYDH